LPLRFEKQFGIIQNPFADRGRASSPGAIQLAGFALLVIQLRGSGASQPTMRSVRDGGYHFQIA